VRAVTVPGVDWAAAADTLDSLLAADVIERALILGWHPLELIGVSRAKPHDHPARAGLFFSLRPGETVPSVHDGGCVIAVAGSNVRHIWRRMPLPDDGSLCLPWELRKGEGSRLMAWIPTC